MMNCKTSIFQMRRPPVQRPLTSDPFTDWVCLHVCAFFERGRTVLLVVPLPPLPLPPLYASLYMAACVTDLKMLVLIYPLISPHPIPH